MIPEQCSGAPSPVIPEGWSAPGWQRGGDLRRTFAFADYAATLRFVNTVAALAEAENHHPDIHFGYNRCTVIWSTHDTGGISTFDYICAAATDRLAR